MAWIELHEAVRDHWKIQRMADLSGVRYAEAEGWTNMLWLWAVSNARSGDLSKFTSLELARGARCEVKAEEFLEKMMESGLINSKRKINDWRKYGVSKLEKNRKSVEDYRRRKETLPSYDSKRNRTVPTVPYQPDLTKPLNVVNGASPKGGDEKPNPSFVEEVVGFCDDQDSRGGFIVLIRDYGEGQVREAMGEVKMIERGGNEVRNRGAFITEWLKKHGVVG